MYTTYGTGFGKFSQTHHIELENTDISRGIRNRKEKKTPSAESLMVSEHENTFHRSRPVYGE